MIDAQLSKEEDPRALSQPDLSQWRRVWGRDRCRATSLASRRASCRWRSARSSQASIRAPSALSPWSNYDGALVRSHVVLARMREEGFITAEQEAAATEGAAEDSALSRRDGSARRLCQGVPAATVPRSLRWRPSAGLGSADDVHSASCRRCGACGRGWAAPVRPAAAAGGPCGYRSRNRRHSGAGRRAGLRQSQFNRATRSRRQPGSAFKPFLYAAALERGFSPVSVLEGLASDVRAEGPEEWAPRNSGGETPDQLTLRAALIESNNRAATLLQQRIGSRPVLRSRPTSASHDLPDVPSLSLGTGLVTPLELTACVRRVSERRDRGTPRGIVRVIDADGGVAYDNPIQTERVLSRGDGVSDGDDARGRDRSRDGRGGARAGASASRSAARPEQRTTSRMPGSSASRHRSSRVSGSASISRATIGRDAYGSRYALPIWSDFMRQASRRRRPDAFEPPSGLRDDVLCSVSYMRPVEGCPIYTEYFKEDDVVPGRLCSIHQGSVKQRVRRALEGALSQLGRKIRDILR